MESHCALESRWDYPVHRVCCDHSEGLERHEGAKLLAAKHNTNGSHMCDRSDCNRRRCHLLSRLSLRYSLGSTRRASVNDCVTQIVLKNLFTRRNS